MIDAEEVLKNINIKAAELAETDSAFEMGFARLGWMILEAAEMRYWLTRYDTFSDFLRTVATISKRTVAQLHRYFLTVRDLSGGFTLEQLEQMGITKAMALRAAKDYAIVLPSALIQAALDSTVTAKDLKKLIDTTLKAPEETGDWFDLDFAFYVTPEERITVESAIQAALRVDPPVKNTISAIAQRKEVVLRWSMEFLASHPEEI